MRQVKTFFVLLTIVFFGAFVMTGCAQDQAGVSTSTQQEASPIDALSIDGRIDNLQTDDGSIDAVEGMDSQTSDELAQKQNNLAPIYFGFDEYEVSLDMESAVIENAETLNRSSYAQNNIKLEGNADEWGTDEYNYALGLKRAKAVKDYLISEGVSEERVSIISYGESNPTCQAKTQECWGANRRVETKLLP